MKHAITLTICVALQLVQILAARADLKPSEIAIITARDNRGSERLAEYYAQQRNIPAENICRVLVTEGEDLNHEKWKWNVRPEIRKWLLDNDPKEEIRCLVTTWGIPLRIQRDKVDSKGMSRYAEYLQGERTKRLKLLKDMSTEFGLLAPGVSPTEIPDLSTPSNPDAKQSAQSEVDKLQVTLERELQLAQSRIQQLTDPDAKKQATEKVQRYASAVGGIQVLLQTLQNSIANSGESAKPLQTDFAKLSGMYLAYSELQQKLDRAAAGIERDAQILDIITRTSGMINAIKWIDKQLKDVRRNETHSSFDSELSLVRWPDDDYQKLRWQPNYLRMEYRNSQLRDSYPTVMVARIDAPTLALAKGLIDTAIKVEEEGLQGKVYLDARGIGKLEQNNVSPGSYADFDRALLITAKGMREQTSLEVVLDEQPALFQDGDCPDAALYCGWYSLGKYVDAFEWNPGAVAYHLASAEATTLHKEDSQVWCKRMLEDGVCATIGPVFEPYLIAFPRPNEFFSLLLQGKLSLVECYYQTKPFNSWMMTLIGDPLYRPFAKRIINK